MIDAFRVKEWIRDSYLPQWAYVRTATMVGRAKAHWGQNLGALRTLLPAWRTALLTTFPPLGAVAVDQIVRRTCYDQGELLAISHNGLLAAFLDTEEAQHIRERFGQFPLAHRLRLRIPRENDNPERQGNLVLLKCHNAERGERGVILLKYTESFLWFAALYDLSEIASRYLIVLEPSSSGYQDWKFLLYLGQDLDVVVCAPYPPDFHFIESLDANLVPIRLGAGDWVDPQTFQPKESTGRGFDLVMVSGWHPIKRHALLFRTLARLRREGYRKLRAALVGYPLYWPRRKIEGLMRKHGVQDQCVIFEDIPHSQVADIVADASAFVLLSKHEGANKALYESLFCGTPVIVSRDHRGVNPDHVPEEAGVRFRPGGLAEAIRRVLENPDRFEPRKWALSVTGWPRATEQLDQVLAEVAARRGEPWTIPIVAKKNAPNLLYAEEGRYQEFKEEYEGLERYLRP